MLLIGDIHINSLYKDRILDSIVKFIDNNDNEKDIVFLGDFVYHFSYDRKALLDLLSVIILQYSKGKSIYVLAGNHDWINDTYVYQEAQFAFDKLNEVSKNVIKFITNPEIIEIEGKQCLFLPYNIYYYNSLVCPDIENLQGNNYIKQLSESNNKNERYSAYLNFYLDKQLKDNSIDYVFHHHYFTNTKFPGQKAQFNYKDLALSNEFLQNKSVKYISGHLHTGFCQNNYFCSGSVWASSPLEENDFKFLYKIDLNLSKIFVCVSAVNFYLSIEDKILPDDGMLTKSNFQGIFKNIWDSNISLFQSDVFSFQFEEFQPPKAKDCSIYLKSDEYGYDNIKDKISEELIIDYKEFKIKKYSQGVQQISQLLDISAKDLQNNISDWKNLLKEYLKGKYPVDYDKYIEKLKDLDIL